MNLMSSHKVKGALPYWLTTGLMVEEVLIGGVGSDVGFRWFQSSNYGGK